jgi:hypothetical protein
MMRDDSKSQERMKEPLVKGLNLAATNLIKRNFNQYTSEKNENIQKL